MFNVKLSGIIGTLAFVLSFLLGIISGARIPVVLLRALIFAAAFMVLSGGIYALVSTYLPDLLSPPEMPGNARGRVDISVGDPAEEGLTSSYFRGGDENLGEFGNNPDISNENIDTLPGDGLDHNQEDGYTMGGGAEPSAGEPEISALEPEQGSSEAPASEGDLPDFDRMASALGGASDDILSTGDAGPTPSAGSSGPATFNAQFVGGSMNKNTPEMAEDFDINEMASAIQTILKREDKG